MSYVQPRQYENLVDLRDRAREEVGKVVVGQGDAVDLLLVAALAQGHVLIEGPPGSAKTLLGRAMAHVLGAKFKRIQFTPDTSPDEITGCQHDQDGRAGLHARRRLHERPPRRRDQPHPTAQPGGAARGDAGAHRHGRRARRTSSRIPFLVIATQNPYEHEGIFPLPESQLDRFMFKIILDYADSESEIEMLRLPHTGVTPDMLGEIQSLLGVVGLDRARADLDLTDRPDRGRRLRRRGRAAHPSESRPGARCELPIGDPHAERREGSGATRRPRPRHDRGRAGRRAVRAAPPPDLPRGHDARTTPCGPHSTR